jgi:hypothetical protein
MNGEREQQNNAQLELQDSIPIDSISTNPDYWMRLSGFAK